jgi:hypothetical protein
MSTLMLFCCLTSLTPLQGEPGLRQSLDGMAGSALEIAALLLIFTLAIFLLLVFAVRVLLIVSKRPVPADLFDMAKPKGFRTLMLGSSIILAPLVAWEFLPVGGVDLATGLAVAYVFEALLAVVLWLLLEAFYRYRSGRQRS